MFRCRNRFQGILLALLVTFLWSTSWVLIKIGLREIPVLTFAGLRYLVAFLCLIPFLALRRNRVAVRDLNAGTWVKIIILGVVFYSITQGAQFVSLSFFPAVTTSLALSFTPVVVAIGGILFLKEAIFRRQWLGISLYLAGILLFFGISSMPSGEWGGFLAVGICVLANAVSSILGRDINRAGTLKPELVTGLSMGAGSILLFAAGLCLEGWVELTATGWLIVFWLALVNTALAFTLWNASLQVLTAVESSFINNTMLFQIVILAWIFLGEQVSLQQLAGIVAAGTGIILVQQKARA